jgi:hypothetical protein
MADTNKVGGTQTVAPEKRVPAAAPLPPKANKPAPAPPVEEEEEDTASKKASCPITRKQFREKAAKALKVEIDDTPLTAPLKEFSTGSLGWYANGRITVNVDGVPVTVQVGLNLTIVGSKDAK